MATFFHHSIFTLIIIVLAGVEWCIFEAHEARSATHLFEATTQFVVYTQYVLRDAGVERYLLYRCRHSEHKNIVYI